MTEGVPESYGCAGSKPGESEGGAAKSRSKAATSRRSTSSSKSKSKQWHPASAPDQVRDIAWRGPLEGEAVAFIGDTVGIHVLAKAGADVTLVRHAVGVAIVAGLCRNVADVGYVVAVAVVGCPAGDIEGVVHPVRVAVRRCWWRGRTVIVFFLDVADVGVVRPVRIHVGFAVGVSVLLWLGGSVGWARLTFLSVLEWRNDVDGEAVFRNVHVEDELPFRQCFPRTAGPGDDEQAGRLRTGKGNRRA